VPPVGSNVVTRLSVGTRAAPRLILLLVAVAACRRAPSPTVAEGRRLYSGNGCATCHGPTGHGDGPIADTLVSRPRDLRDAIAFKHGTDMLAIAATLANGIGSPDGSSPQSGHLVEHEQRWMPRFDHLTQHERESIALFVISLRNSSKERQVQP
jgi:mono/diheme cytochrome c family protein